MCGELEENMRQKIPFDLLEIELVVKKKKCQWDQRDHPDGRTIGGSME